MGIEAALTAMGMSAGTASAVSTGVSVISGLSSVLQGFQQSSEYKQQSQNAIASAEMAAKERARVSFKESQIIKQDADDFERRQKLAYLKSGVSLEGSPLLILEETRRKAAENVDEVLRASDAASGASLYEAQGTARALRLKGRQAFSSGFGDASKQFASIDWSKLK